MTPSACVGHKKYPGTLSPRTRSSRSGRITILFGCCILVAISDAASTAAASSATAGHRTNRATPQRFEYHSWPFTGKGSHHHGGGGGGGRAEDVQVFFRSGRDGIRSQSISFAHPNGGSERFPRQLDTVHDHLMGYSDENREQWPRQTLTPTTFDREYDRFINEHFRNNYQLYRPKSESDQMARDHERFRELPHYQSKPFPAGQRRRLENFKTQPQRTSVQEDVEYHQPSDETLAAAAVWVRPGHTTDDDYQGIEQWPEEQKQQKELSLQCKSVRRGDMLCQMCRNPHTGAKSESCSYASKPHSKKYAYANKYTKKKTTGGGSGVDEDGNSSSEEDEEDPEIQTSRPLRKRNQSKMDRSPRIKREGNGKTKSGRWRRRRIRNGNDDDGRPEDSERIELYEGGGSGNDGDASRSSGAFPEFHEYRTDASSKYRSEDKDVAEQFEVRVPSMDGASGKGG